MHYLSARVGVLAPAALLLLGLIGGCGDGGSATTTAATRPFPYVTGPTRQFLVAGGDNAIQLFGQEASPAERREASRVIHGWMAARADARWRSDCRYLSRAYRRTLVTDAHGVSGGRVTSCPAALRFFGAKASGNRVNTLTGPIDSLRVGEGHGYAQYHGPHGVDWIVPMDRENGHWKVAIASPVNRNG